MHRPHPSFEPLPSPLDRDQDFGPIGSQVVQVLKGIYDPEIPVSIWDLGLIYMLDVDDQQGVYIKMTLTTPNCPAAESLPSEVEEKVGYLPHVASVKLDLTFDPPYHPDYMTEEAKIVLGFL
jgi:FeS assembly SUF system protein